MLERGADAIRLGPRVDFEPRLGAAWQFHGRIRRPKTMGLAVCDLPGSYQAAAECRSSLGRMWGS